jgi:hypothetical protein
MLKKLNDKILNYSIFDYFLLLLIINLALITLALIFYGDKFNYLYYPFSYLGAQKTFNLSINNFSDINNTASSIIYSIDMFVSGLLTFTLFYKFYSTHLEKLQSLLFFVAGLGFIIAGFSPDDARHNFHVLGSALFVACLWILASNYLLMLGKNISRAKFYLLEALLQIPIFGYATAYFLNMDPYSEILQKIALVSLFFIFLYSTKRLG